MPTTLKTPGVYIEEKDAFGNSVVAVETAVPVFIGYTQNAQRNGKSLVGTPFKISSLKEYNDYFGGAFKPVYTIADLQPDDVPPSGDFKFTVTDITGTSATLKWTPVNEADTNDVVFKKASDADFAAVTDADKFAANVKERKLTGLTPGTGYECRIIKDGETDLTKAVTQKFTTANVTFPADIPPTGDLKFTATNITNTSATLNWTPANTADTYDVVFKKSSDADFPAVADTDKFAAAVKVRNLTGLTPGTSYDCKIIKDGETDATKAITLKFTTANPVLLKATKDAVKLNINDSSKVMKLNENNIAYFYNSIRLFFDNGGSDCFIYSIGTYGDSSNGLEINSGDITDELFDRLKKEFEPTLVIIPDMIASDDCYMIYQKVLDHCFDTQSRFGIFDLFRPTPTDSINEIVGPFRDDIGIGNLKYGAAYYPWLKTTIVKETEVNFTNINDVFNPMSGLISLVDPDKEKAAIDVINLTIQKAKTKKLNATESALTGDAKTQAINAKSFAISDLDDNDITHLHQSLKAASPTYAFIMKEILEQVNELPPSGAIAGIYSSVDSARGVWKAPANVSVKSVTAPSVNISNEEQEDLNVDVMAGKSINVIRPFPGIGTLVWGGRTLDGNSLDWKYINVRRTTIMIEQTIKLAMRAYVFEPNDNSTWITVKSMINNFLNGLWKQGALFGTTPAEAYDVQVGLGSTMTQLDLLEGRMLVSVKVAMSRPAEFIVLTFQQMQQQAS